MTTPHVFVIAMENKAQSSIYGSVHAPYINDVLRTVYASASAYRDVVPDVPSEPHYIWAESGTNAFDDHTFTTNQDPSAENSTADTRHIVAQLDAMNDGRTWRSYQEGLDENATGKCPIFSAGFYAAKHNPFIFFQDVAGSPPSATNQYCVDHHRGYSLSSFGADLAIGDVAAYTFITPDQCNDMHGQDGCENGCVSGDATCIREGDRWLEDNVPPIIDFINTHGGVLFILWDESEGDDPFQPFIVVGPTVKPGHVSGIDYTHSSFVKTVQTILGLPIDERVSDANDFSDLFNLNQLP